VRNAGTGTNVYATTYTNVVSGAPLKNYNGRVYITQIDGSSDLTTVAILCEAKAAGFFSTNFGDGINYCPPDKWNQVGN